MADEAQEEDFSKLLVQLSRKEFMERAQHPFLFVAAPGEPASGFHTRTTTTKGAHARSIQIIPVLKRAGNPYPDRISVGRAANCDVVLRDPSVSKLHAHIVMRGSKFELIDLESHNGTLVNGRKLTENAAQSLKWG